jgi:metal-responsive CopG/Arc/MetJ family transcriptional regulator
MKTAISVPDETFHRVDDAARRMGVSRSEFFSRAAERWLDTLEGDDVTEAINRALEGVEQDTTFVRAAAEALAAKHWS